MRTSGRARRLKAATVVIGIGALLIGAVIVPPGFAQEAAPGKIFLDLTQPAQSVPVDTLTRDDLREAPTPRVDKLSDTVRVIVVVGDPRCEPGDLGWVDSWRGDRRALRRR